MHHVYFLKSKKNGKYYVGQTERVPSERLKEHNWGVNKWARENGPFELVYYESYLCKADALNREKFYKSGFGRRIKDIILQAVNGPVA